MSKHQMSLSGMQPAPEHQNKLIASSFLHDEKVQLLTEETCLHCGGRRKLTWQEWALSLQGSIPRVICLCAAEVGKGCEQEQAVQEATGYVDTQVRMEYLC